MEDDVSIKLKIATNVERDIPLDEGVIQYRNQLREALPPAFYPMLDGALGVMYVAGEEQMREAIRRKLERPPGSAPGGLKDEM